MRDPGVIDALDALERYARAFDAISDELETAPRDGERLPAIAGDASKVA